MATKYRSMELIIRTTAQREAGIVPELYTIERRESDNSISHSAPIDYEAAVTAIRELREQKIPSSLCRLWLRQTAVAHEMVCAEDSCSKVIAHLA